MRRNVSMYAKRLRQQSLPIGNVLISYLALWVLRRADRGSATSLRRRMSSPPATPAMPSTRHLLKENETSAYGY
jgi:hypothetical protein